MTRNLQLRWTRWAIRNCQRQIAYHERRIAKYRAIEAESWKLLAALDPTWLASEARKGLT